MSEKEIFKGALIKTVLGQKAEMNKKLIEQLASSPTGKQTFAALPAELQKTLLNLMTPEQRQKVVAPLKVEG